MMPGFIVTLGQVVLCAHGGTATPTAPNPRVKIMGQPVVTQGAPFVVAGCPYVPPAPGPCVSADFVTGATRIKVMGQPVLLQDSQAIATPTGTPLTILPGQPRVRGM